MSQLQLYINDDLVDLADDSPVALTFQINNLAEVKNQQGNTSNQFKLPLTQRNRQILGFPDDVAFTTALPYNNYQAKIIQDGLEIVPAGLAVLNSVDNDTAAITVLSGNVDFFDNIDVKIYDMGDSSIPAGELSLFKPYQHDWTISNVISSQSNTEGWIWPVVDYGRIAYPVNDPVTVDVRDLRPGFFLKTAIEIMAQHAGYKINPNSFLLKQSLYQKLIVQFANDSFEHGTDYQQKDNTVSLKDNYSSIDQIITRPRVDGPNAPYDYIYFNTTSYTAARDIKCTATLNFDLYLRGTAGGSYPSHVHIFFVKVAANGTESGEINALIYDLANDAEIISPPFAVKIGQKTFNKQKLSADFDLQAGEKIFARYGINHIGSPNNLQNTYGKISKGASFTVDVDQKEVLYSYPVQCERIFPDITLKDLLKDTLQRFGIICQTDNTTRTITFASFRDIVNNIPAAKNWTGKCLNQGKNISFQLGGYAQVNYMKYKEDDAILPKNYSSAQINVSDKTLPANADLLESQFAPTLTRPFVGGTIAQINKVDHNSDDTDYSINTQPRILINRMTNLRDAGNKTIKFTDGKPGNDRFLNDEICTPQFYNSANESLLWDDLRKAYYPELEKILQQTKKVVRYFMLTPRDILELDLLIPVYLEQDSAYYYINKIDSWRKGQPVKVELVKLG
ncbi:hypothetical protein EWM62_03770 [Mucilaginibacter terrigena]|uniref:Uncharacterized protein n=1 Tax=Mucilaginibacter terrigena TaxID=2492395 RepID=A0A4Q5LNW4_9SPHI|nr:hypothetical protein [Mucilaginibacter terrigena]RYU91065.1 hypothetical protein EWM62_03770 [Mucilaginibacter terrigena]